MSVIGERQVTGKWQEAFRPKSIDMVWIWKVFGSVITVGS